MSSRFASVILGGTGSIGSAVARRLAHPQGTLVLSYLQNRARAESMAAELSTSCAEVQLVEGNVADQNVLDEISRRVAAVDGGCRHLVHSVAVTSFKPFLETRSNQWDLVFAVSARSLLGAAVRLIGELEKARGAVVAISSTGSVRHVPSYGPLGPAKAALESTVRELAVELAPRGIRVNAVRAGLIASEVVERLPKSITEDVARRTPLGRLGTPEEVASAAGFLLASDASWITGQILDADGGFGLIL